MSIPSLVFDFRFRRGGRKSRRRAEHEWGHPVYGTAQEDDSPRNDFPKRRNIFIRVMHAARKRYVLSVYNCKRITPVRFQDWSHVRFIIESKGQETIRWPARGHTPSLGPYLPKNSFHLYILNWAHVGLHADGLVLIISTNCTKSIVIYQKVDTNMLYGPIMIAANYFSTI